MPPLPPQISTNKEDEVLSLIADYVCFKSIVNDEAYTTARLCLADALGCAILALKYRECTKLLGPISIGTIVPHGCRVPGTNFVLDPIFAAFNIGLLIRWLDFNDTWLAAEWGHPSDNIGGIFAAAEFISRRNLIDNRAPLKVKDVLTAIVKAYEIQGGLALLNSFNRIGFDHVIFVKVATSAVVTHLLGGNRDHIINAISQAFLDSAPLRTYRHAPSTGSRKSWAAGDATSRGTMLSLITMRGEMGYPHVLTSKRWGLYDVLFQGKPFEFQRPLDSYVIENILFKIAFPAEFHAQTAIECAFTLHLQVKGRLNDIALIKIMTQEAAVKIIDKQGILKNPADRDHCLQYMVAVALLKGSLDANDYEDNVAQDPSIDMLRDKMTVQEDPQYSKDYLDPQKRSIANAIQIFFKDGSETSKVVIEYPLGHRKRRQESLPMLFKKLEDNLCTRFTSSKVKQLVEIFQNQRQLDEMAFTTFSELFQKEMLTS